LLSYFQGDQYLSAVPGAHICSWAQRLPLLGMHRFTNGYSRRTAVNFTPSYPRRLEPSVPVQLYRMGIGSATTTDWDFIKTGSWQ
jgi:hypothetical protein